MEPYAIDVLSIASGGKALKVNKESYYNYITDKNNEYKVAGPSGTAYFIIQCANLFSFYATNQHKKGLLLSIVGGVCHVPHHSIHEVLLAGAMQPFALDRVYKGNAEEYINVMLKEFDIQIPNQVKKNEVVKRNVVDAFMSPPRRRKNE